MLNIDYRTLISSADLIYHSPVEKAVEGQPIGNGEMGTFVWTTQNVIHFQLNRCDVFAVNKNHAGRQAGPTDYCGGCASLTLDLGGDPFCQETFTQRLSLYDAEVSIAGVGISVRCFISAVSDVLVLEVNDQRPEPQPIHLTVSMWRPPLVKTKGHTAQHQFIDVVDSVCLVQEFTEKDHYCASAVAAQIVTDETHIKKDDNAHTIVTPAAMGKTEIVVSSASSWSSQTEVGMIAVNVLQETLGLPYEVLRKKHQNWWHRFWERTFVHIEFQDNSINQDVGHFMSCVRNLHLYNMASTSRGSLPPKWNGSLFTTEGDKRQWGSQFWVWTTEMLYFPLFAADAIDLTNPYFSMYNRHLPDCECAAWQRWGIAGAYFPETAPFDGPTILPDDVALEVQAVLRGKKAYTELSERAYSFCQFDSHLRVITNPHIGRYSWISHVASSGSELAIQAWWRFRYTGDAEWLRDQGYPLLKGTVEFYRHLVAQGDGGQYYLYGTNVHEDFWGAKNSIMDLAAIRGTVPLAIRAAEILETDTDLRAKWRELIDNLAPYPMGSDHGSKALTGGFLADDAWAAGHLGDVDGQHNPEDIWLNPIFPFEDWTLETEDPRTDRIVQKTVELARWMPRIFTGEKLGTAIRTPIVWSRVGRGDQLPSVLASYYASFTPLVNGFSLFEGEQAHSIEHLGCITTTLQDALLQSLSPHPGQPEVISLFPAWPKIWDTSFRLLARGGFMVTSAIRQGEVTFVKVESRLGEICQIRNPWDITCTIFGTDTETKETSGKILRFDTKQGEHYIMLPKGKSAFASSKISPEPAKSPISYSLSLANGTTHQGTLGRS